MTYALILLFVFWTLFLLYVFLDTSITKTFDIEPKYSIVVWGVVYAILGTFAFSNVW